MNFNWMASLVPTAAVISAAVAYKLVVVLLPRTDGPPLAGEHLNDPGHLFRSLCLHFIVWSGTQNRYVKEIKVFQACACGVCIE